eukprot:5984865-Pyramimonas_sp.AAC.1
MRNPGHCHWSSLGCPSPLGGGLAAEACPRNGSRIWGLRFRAQGSWRILPIVDRACPLGACPPACQ